ncbi:MAG: flagellar hook capping FlgD N-terminal domain-containing protein [Solirubrobacteraceae bacterium]
MTTIPPTTSSPPASAQAAGGANATMGKDDFLKLFVAQLQHQDPMNPMQDADFMGQMASFSTLEQVSNMASENARIAQSLTSSNAIGLIGRTVTWTDEDGATHTGAVEKVSTVDGKPSLTVAGAAGVDPSSITQVA